MPRIIAKTDVSEKGSSGLSCPFQLIIMTVLRAAATLKSLLSLANLNPARHDAPQGCMPNVERALWIDASANQEEILRNIVDKVRQHMPPNAVLVSNALEVHRCLFTLRVDQHKLSASHAKRDGLKAVCRLFLIAEKLR